MGWRGCAAFRQEDVGLWAWRPSAELLAGELEAGGAPSWGPRLVWRVVELEFRGWTPTNRPSGIVLGKNRGFLSACTSLLGTLTLVQECGRGWGPEWGCMYCVTSDQSLNISGLRRIPDN